MRAFISILVLLAAGAGATWWFAGRGAPPSIQIAQPAKLIGQKGELNVVVDTPKGRLVGMTVAIEQGGKTIPLFSLEKDAGKLVIEGDQVRFVRPIGKRDLPALVAGPAKVIVTATRPVLFGYRQIEGSTSKD